MSDLAATNCGCDCATGGSSNCLWLILILLFCGGGCGNGFGGNDCGNGCGGDFIWIILLLSCCGGGNGFF